MSNQSHRLSNSTDRPKLLDLFCGQGGAGMGYYQAGFHVEGVDIVDRTAYPFTFHRADAIAYLIDHGQEFDVVHASPPCQAYSIATPTEARTRYPTGMIAQVREICDVYALPLILENVPRAEREYRHPVFVEETPDGDVTTPVQRPITLCGEMFGLRVIRHRTFEVGEMVSPLKHLKHKGSIRGGQYITVAGHGADNPKGSGSIKVWQEAMGMPWVKNRHELAEAIPPAFTKYIGSQILAWL